MRPNSEVIKFDNWMRKMGNIYLPDDAKMTEAYNRVATHKIRKNERKN